MLELNPSFLFRQKKVVDVCCEYVLLPLVNKEAAVFGQWLNRVKPG